ncbi:MAG: ATP-binding cassette domain-containing protein [Gammaproteobacteria bacterium]|nr:ATP-binding cassette domain-containing protein [Gammaproteobacteria bacterium]
MGEFGKNFSGGQIRRIAIARALLHNAPIIILDEPSTGLEEALMQRIWQNCEVDFENKTVIVITHDQKLLDNMDQCITLGPSPVS